MLENCALKGCLFVSCGSVGWCSAYKVIAPSRLRTPCLRFLRASKASSMGRNSSSDDESCQLSFTVRFMFPLCSNSSYGTFFKLAVETKGSWMNVIWKKVFQKGVT